MTKEEEVFCLRRSELAPLFGGSLPQGAFRGVGPEQILALDHHFTPRSRAESDPLFKQLIPYQLFVFKGSFFVYRRGGSVGEGRLAGRLSLGIGGHINRGDSQDSRLLTPVDYRNALLRERSEELINVEEFNCRFVGWINDDSSAVGSVHLGAVHLVEVESERARRALGIRADGEDIHSLGWWTAEEIKAERDLFELWSILAIELV